MEKQSDKQYVAYDDNLNSSTLTPESLLLHLIFNNDIDSIKEFGVKYKNVNYLETFNEVEIDAKITPLICSTYLGRLEIVKLLLENESLDIDMSSEDIGHTPLTIACITGNYEILRLLIQYRAEVNKPTLFNQTPFICCFQRLEEEQNVFENRKICLKMAELLLQYGADIDWIVDKKKGYTLLMQLCALKMELSPKEKEINFEIIKFLLENGANRKIKTKKQKTAYELAAKHCNNIKLQELLVNAQQIYFYNKKEMLEYEKQQQNTFNMKTDIQLHKEEQPKNKSIIKYLAFCNK